MIRVGDAHDLQEQAQPIDGLDERLVVHGLGDVDAASQLVAALNFARIVGRGQHDDGDQRRLRIGLELTQHLDAVNPRHLDVEQQEHRTGGVFRPAYGSLALDEVEGLLAVLESVDAVGQTGPFQVALDQVGVSVVVLDEHDQDRLGCHVGVLLVATWVAGGGSAIAPLRGARPPRRAGRATKKVVPTPAADSSQILPPCRSTIRRTRARPMPSPCATFGVESAEGGEDALVVCLGNAQTVVLDVIDLEARHRARRARVGTSHFDSTRPRPGSR